MSKSIKLQDETYAYLRHYQVDLSTERRHLVTVSEAVDQLLILAAAQFARKILPQAKRSSKGIKNGT